MPMIMVNAYDLRYPEHDEYMAILEIDSDMDIESVLGFEVPIEVDFDEFEEGDEIIG